MLYYVVEAVTKDTAKRLVSFHEYKAAAFYADHIINQNPNSFWVGVVDQDEWYQCFA